MGNKEVVGKIKEQILIEAVRCCSKGKRYSLKHRKGLGRKVYFMYLV